MNHLAFRTAVTEPYAAVYKLEAMFPGRPFTPDGHLVGSMGECLVAEAYSLSLTQPSNKRYDAIAPDGRKVEIKTTQTSRVAFRSAPEHCIVIKLNIDGSFEECYNGPGKPIWDSFAARGLPSNGQYQISLSALAELQQYVADSERFTRAI